MQHHRSLWYLLATLVIILALSIWFFLVKAPAMLVQPSSTTAAQS